MTIRQQLKPHYLLLFESFDYCACLSGLTDSKKHSSECIDGDLSDGGSSRASGGGGQIALSSIHTGTDGGFERRDVDDRAARGVDED